jgi:Terminase large subunit, T4likevirus-type, N-terminal/Terminase RNaseH-like domain/LAGLIDADG-like domain
MSEIYLGNKNLKNKDVKIQYTKEQVEEYIKCSQDINYFCEKYVKIVSVDKGLINFNPFQYQKNMFNTFESNRYTICKMPRQVGKALDINTEIPTVNGWKTMKDINIGDTIFDMYGVPTRVTFKSDIHLKDTYKITFSDNTSATACKDHIWYGFDYNGSNKYRKEMREFTTEQIFNSGVMLYNSDKEYRYAIPLTEAVQYKEKDLPIDPYTLGLWLGDGVSASGMLVMLEDDFNNIKHNIPYDYTVYKRDKKNNNILYVRIEGLTKLLNDNNILNNKHIPDMYMQGSVNQRRELLSGLLDTDGTVSGYVVSFTQSIIREKLINQVKELVYSLGYKVSEYRYNSDKPSITIRFCSHDKKSFLLERKSKKQKLSSSSSKTRKKQIVNIELIETLPTQCIQVDSETHTFLFSRNYTVTHNTTGVVGYLLHKILFNENYNIAVLANKQVQAREILSRVQLAYEWLPKWLQQGIIEWNKGNIELENGSKILASATSSSAVRGQSYNLVYLDEFAFVPRNVQDAFFASVFPTISSGNTSKLLITSTPNGMNLFYKIWTDSENGENDYARVDVHWSDVPGRDEAWKEKTIRATSEDQFRQEFECEFLGSANTLIHPTVLSKLTYKKPIAVNAGVKIYKEPLKDHVYVMTVDVSEGLGLDASSFVVTDCTTVPYEVVATFKDSNISQLLFPTLINNVGKYYNEAAVLVETNVGSQVVNILHQDLEYGNVIMTKVNGRKGTVVGADGLSRLGLKTTKVTKRIGCANIKSIIEDSKIILNDYDIINELSTYIVDGTTHNADDGYHDDLVMCLVMFAWLIQQNYFKEVSNTDIRMRILEEQEDNFTPFGIVDDGHPDDLNGKVMSDFDFERYLLN